MNFCEIVDALWAKHSCGLDLRLSDSRGSIVSIKRFSVYIMAYTPVSTEAYTESYVKPVVALWERCFHQATLVGVYISIYTLNRKCGHIHEFS